MAPSTASSSVNDGPSSGSARAVVSTIPNGVKFLFGGMSGAVGTAEGNAEPDENGEQTVGELVNIGAELEALRVPVTKRGSHTTATRMGATVFVQPLDLVKNRMQLSGKEGQAKEHRTSLHAMRAIVRAEGLLGMYNGLSAGLLRQATYTTTRLGTYTTLMERASGGPGSPPPPFLVKAALGMVAGAIGAFVGTPAEVALIRMTSDGRLPVNERRGYTSVFNALIRITREEGLLTLWRGCIPTINRAVVVNAAQLASYSQAKQSLLSTGYFSDNISCHFCASMLSGLVTTAASMPVDIAKTRVQNMKIIDGKPEYKNGMDVLVRVIRLEGIFSLWKGFTPYYARLGPHTVLTFIFLEQLNSLYLRRIA